MGVFHGISKPDIKHLIENRDIDGLLRIVTLNDYIGFSEMIFALKKMGEDALPSLFRALHDPDINVREIATLVLGELKDPTAISYLINMLSDDEWHVRFHAVLSLSLIGDAAIAPLIQTLKAEDKDLRGGAVRTLGELRDSRAVPALIESLHDGDKFVRISVCWALGELKDPRSIEPLIQALSDIDPEVQCRGALALKWTRDPKIIDPLIQALRDTNSGIRRDAAIALGELGDKRAVDPLIQALKDEYWNVREGAAIALGHLNDRRAIDPLKEVLNDLEFKYVQNAANEALDKIKNTASLPPSI